MNEHEKKLRDAALQLYPINLDYFENFDYNNKERLAFIKGAKSDEAQKYWQQHQAKEVGINELITDFYDWIHSRLEPSTVGDIFEWFKPYLRPQESKWISVKDRLPEKVMNVLCIQDPLKTATRKPLFAIFDGTHFIPPAPTVYADFSYGKSKWSDITHWQPLPEPPKEK